MKCDRSWTNVVFRRFGNTPHQQPRSRSRQPRLSFEGLEKRELLTGTAGSVEPPILTINGGLELTNIRSVDVALDNVAADAQSMRFAFNGFNYGEWKTFSPATKVTIPSYQGTNYVNAEILFADGTTDMVYDSIVYKNPTVVINGGAGQSNTRDVTLSFGDAAPDAVSVQLAYNGFNYHAPVGFASTMTVTLPNYPGKNYVNAQIIYAGQQKRFVWDSIEYLPASVKIDNGKDVTNDRKVELTFENVTVDAEKVSFAFNGFNYQADVDFAPTMTVTLPNWEGANYVNAKIQYSDGRELWLWDSIDYVAPIEVKSCSECIAFQLLIQDGRNEGFRDDELGQDRVNAFSYALGIWSSLLHASYDGEKIAVDATMDPIPNTSDGSIVLGGARPNHFWKVGEQMHAAALANHRDQMDHDIIASEIVAQFNSDVHTWYYGIDGNPGQSQDDFVTTVLHEIGHGLNFVHTILYGVTSNDGTRIPDGSWRFSYADGAPIAGIYDSFLVTDGGTKLTSMSDADRASAITSGKLFWDGPNAKAGNGGERPQIYAPTTYKPGSSVSHLDELTYGVELMSPWLTCSDHSPSELELGMLEDMGWTLVG